MHQILSRLIGTIKPTDPVGPSHHAAWLSGTMAPMIQAGKEGTMRRNAVLMLVAAAAVLIVSNLPHAPAERSVAPRGGGDDTPVVFDDTVFVDANDVGRAPFDAAITQRRVWPWVTPSQLATVVDRAGLHSINVAMALTIESMTGRFDSATGDSTNDLDGPLSTASTAFYVGRASSSLPDAGLRSVARALAPDAPPDDALADLRAAFTTVIGAPQVLVVAPPASARSIDSGTVSVAGPIPPIGFLSLPFPVGAAWAPGGVHTTTGSNDGSPMSSIDWSHGWPNWGTNTATENVSAMHGGTVTVYSGCNVRVTNANGWATNYYHLSGVVVSTGQVVSTGAVLSAYADNFAQATCQGGSSTGPHVHVSLLRNGFQYAIDGATVNGWLVHSGRRSYDYDPNYMWYVRDGSKSYAYEPILRDDCLVTSNDVDAPSTAGNVGLVVSAGNGCPWEATSETSWISVAAEGSGTATAVLALAANPSTASRFGIVVVAGSDVLVTQAPTITTTVSQRGNAAPVEPVVGPVDRPIPAPTDPILGPSTRVPSPIT
jgi:murein DD-endopeptidase MepM/ murein hydrolase activator NlpD